MDVLWKDWCWGWNSNSLATWCEDLSHLKRPWCWERLRAGGEGDNRGWDGWMALPTQCTWVCINSRSSWWTRRRAAFHGVTKSRTWLSDWTELKFYLQSYTFQANKFLCDYNLRKKKKTISKNMSDFFQLKCFDRDNYLSKRNLSQK